MERTALVEGPSGGTEEMVVGLETRKTRPEENRTAVVEKKALRLQRFKNQ